MVAPWETKLIGENFWREASQRWQVDLSIDKLFYITIHIFRIFRIPYITSTFSPYIVLHDLTVLKVLKNEIQISLLCLGKDTSHKVDK